MQGMWKNTRQQQTSFPKHGTWQAVQLRHTAKSGGCPLVAFTSGLPATIGDVCAQFPSLHTLCSNMTDARSFRLPGAQMDQNQHLDGL